MKDINSELAVPELHPFNREECKLYPCGFKAVGVPYANDAYSNGGDFLTHNGKYQDMSRQAPEWARALEAKDAAVASRAEVVMNRVTPKKEVAAHQPTARTNNVSRGESR